MDDEKNLERWRTRREHADTRAALNAIAISPFRIRWICVRLNSAENTRRPSACRGTLPISLLAARWGAHSSMSDVLGIRVGSITRRERRAA